MPCICLYMCVCTVLTYMCVCVCAYGFGCLLMLHCKCTLYFVGFVLCLRIMYLMCALQVNRIGTNSAYVRNVVRTSLLLIKTRLTGCLLLPWLF